MNLSNSLASEFLGAAESYEAVASEYYDEQLHPTCSDFRSASRLYLKRLFDRCKPEGRIADLGCGKSLVAEFCRKNLVLIDESAMMLGRNEFDSEFRRLNVEQESIGTSEFDWIFAVLGDPYNSPSAWRNIAQALRVGGQCVFIVPSVAWASKFRSATADEQPNLARFVTSTARVVFLRSLIFEPSEQIKIISQAGLTLTSTEHVVCRELSLVKSPKIRKVLAADESLLDVYLARKL